MKFTKTKLQNWQNYFSNLLKKENSHLSTILKDIFIVSTLVFLFTFWFEKNNPGGVANYLNLAILTALLASLFFLSFLNKTISNFFFCSILLLISILNFSNSFIKSYLSKNNYWFQFLEKIKEYDYTISIITLIIFIIFIYQNKNNSSKNKKIKQEKTTENSLSKYFKKNSFVLTLILITSLGFGLRIYNLDYLSPVRDEYSHLNAAKHMLQDGYFNYKRGSIISYATFYSWKIFNNGETSIFWARIISVLLGTIAIPLIYYLGKIISNKKIGLISAFLLATSPFHIGMSRYLREYILFFDFLIIGLIFTIFVYKKIIRKEYKKGIISLIFLIILMSYYQIDRNSTYILNMVITGAFAGFLFLDLLFKNKKIIYKKFSNLEKNKKIISIAVASIMTISLLTYLYWKLALSNMHFKPHSFTNAWINKFLSPTSAIQWFYESFYNIFFIIAFLSIGAIKGFKNVFYRTSFFVFVFMMLFYTFFFNRYDDSRYAFQLQLFLIFLFSFSIYLIFSTRKNNISKFFIILIFVVMTFGPFSAIKLLKNEKNGEKNKIQELVHNETFLLLNELKNLGFIPKKTPLVSPNFLFLYYYDYNFSNSPTLTREKSSNNLFELFPCDKDFGEKIIKIMTENNFGFFVTDKNINYNWAPEELRGETGCMPTENTKFGNYELKYIKDIGGIRGFNIYKWEIK